MRLKLTATIALGALTVLAISVAGCGGGDDNETPSTPSSSAKGASGKAEAGGGQAQAGGGGGGAQSVDISESDFKLNPADPSVTSGKVTFNLTNDGQTDHALEVEGPGEESQSKTIAPGESTSLTVDLSKPGKYEMYCPVDGHKQLGMKGDVTVK